ncbi:hypothetical protein HK25_01305 [Acetobacter sp. DsW_059]|nr:hypothetical protein HK25_01305 [Acetobacter sp. DsW_059]
MNLFIYSSEEKAALATVIKASRFSGLTVLKIAINAVSSTVKFPKSNSRNAGLSASRDLSRRCTISAFIECERASASLFRESSKERVIRIETDSRGSDIPE